MLTPVRRRLAALAMVLMLPALGACTQQTAQVYQPAVGVNNRSGTVDVLGAVVVAPSDGQGTFVASLVNKGQDSPDSLTSVTGDGLQAQVSAPVKVQPDSLVNLADAGTVSVTGTDIRPGKFARLTLTFESGQETTINVPVVSADAEYADIKQARPSSSATP